MDDLTATATIKPKAKVSAEEIARRREALRQADASNRIEGVFRSDEGTQIFDAFIHGEIELEEILPRLKAIHHHP